jgi:hypothetical protein
VEVATGRASNLSSSTASRTISADPSAAVRSGNYLNVFPFRDTGHATFLGVEDGPEDVVLQLEYPIRVIVGACRVRQGNGGHSAEGGFPNRKDGLPVHDEVRERQLSFPIVRRAWFPEQDVYLREHPIHYCSPMTLHYFVLRILAHRHRCGLSWEDYSLLVVK